MLTISNIYGHGFDAAACAKLEALGFCIRPQVSRYMGAQICRFVDFETGPALELIEIDNTQEYLDFIPPGMVPYCPGISLLLPENESISPYERTFQHMEPYSLHVNYDGSNDPGKPGWNYLNFKTPLLPDTFIWLTACDQPKPTSHHETSHSNGITGIVGLVFSLDMNELVPLASLVQDVKIWSCEEVTPPSNKEFPLVAVVLSAPNIPQPNTTFRLRPALHIETNPRSWDLILVEQD
jgi:hypothetical protein